MRARACVRHRQDGAVVSPVVSLRDAGGCWRPGGGGDVRGHRLQPGHAAPGQHPGQEAECRYARTHLVVHGRQGLVQTLNICCST